MHKNQNIAQNHVFNRYEQEAPRNFVLPKLEELHDYLLLRRMVYLVSWMPEIVIGPLLPLMSSEVLFL